MGTTLHLIVIVMLGTTGLCTGWIAGALTTRVATRERPRPRRLARGRRALLALATGVAFAVIAAARLPLPVGSTMAACIELIAFLGFAAVSIALAGIDVETHRLPDAIVLPSIAGSFVLLGAASLLANGGASLLRATVGALALSAFYLAMRLVSPRGMGGGDVKLAALIGVFAGWAGWEALVVASVAAFLIGGLVGIVLILAGRATRGTAIPFGPCMLLGAWIGIGAGERIMASLVT